MATIAMHEHAMHEQKEDNPRQAEFHTHYNCWAERLHQLSEALLLPARTNAQWLARVIQPLPGEHKDYHPLLQITARIAFLALWLLTTPAALLSALIGLPLRCIDQSYRPAIGYIDNSTNAPSKHKDDLTLTPEQPLHIRSHNLGFVSSTMSILGDLRPPVERAKELVTSISEDPQAPDIIFFQEAFHEDATKILCEGIKQQYPYIVHSIAPHISGFNSGALVASKYPLKEVSFHRLDHMVGPEKASPRGLVRVRLETSQGTLLLYGAHTQALLGKERAEAREKQLQDISDKLQADRDNDSPIPQVLVGDLNTSGLTAWGEDNKYPPGQPETEVLEKLEEEFDDLHLRDHGEFGYRTDGAGYAHFLEKDNERLEQPRLTEPLGSWYHGPFADPGLLLSWKMRYDRWKHGYPASKPFRSLGKSTWGTSAWHGEQAARSARFDYILLPKGVDLLDGRVEIRRVIVPKGAQSASSDHLPVDARIWRKQPS